MQRSERQATMNPPRQRALSPPSLRLIFPLLAALACLLTWWGCLLMTEGSQPVIMQSVRRYTASVHSRSLAEGSLTGQQKPSHFLIFFSGHQGSSALADSLATDPAVFIPGFEPLDYPGLNAAEKVAFIDAVFTFPSDAAGFTAWRQELLHGKRVDRSQVQQLSQLAGKSVSGFKMRPYTLDSTTGFGFGFGSTGGNTASNSTLGSRMHTAASGLTTATLRALLERYDVRVVLTLRRNRLKEALSWYKARELGIHQFSGKGKAAAAAAAAQAAAAAVAADVTADLRQAAWQPHSEQRRLLQEQASTASKAGGLAPGAKVTLNISKLFDWLEYTDIVNQALREAAADVRRPTIVVWYEDFLADPLGQARRAAAFVGAPQAGARVQLSEKFHKAGPDDIQAWVANYQELCDALRGTVYYQHLDTNACGSPAIEAAAGTSGKGLAGRGKPTLPAVVGAGGADDLTLAEQPQAGELLSNWCAAVDMAITGWSAMSDQACMQRVLALQQKAVAAVRNGTGTILFKHVHKAGGSTLCQLAKRNMVAQSALLPGRLDWDTNCVPYEAFLGPHPAVGAGLARGTRRSRSGAVAASASGSAGRALQAHLWLGGACWLAFLTSAQLHTLPHHFRPLTFVASEGPLPDDVPLDVSFAWVTMLRSPLDRVLSSYRWWQYMMKHMPQAPAECRAYSAPANASLEQWLEAYPANWMTRELLGRTALYQRRKLTEADLLVAKQRLHYFAAVLLLEEPRSSMALMQQRFGWQAGGWETERAGSRHDSNATAELSPQLLRRVRQRNQFDLRLYEYAQALHANQLRQTGLAE